jgi:Glycosyl hydrolase family 9
MHSTLHKGMADPREESRRDALHFVYGISTNSRAQICYILGGTGRSFVVDFGANSPKRPHHRDSALTLEQSGNWDAFKDASTDNPNVLTGALVGGPGVDDAYADDRQDYKRNEVALDYNAALLLGTVQVLCALEEQAAPPVEPPPVSLLPKEGRPLLAPLWVRLAKGLYWG